MKRLLTRLSRGLGFEVVAYPGGKLHWRQLVQVLERARIDTVLDVGANVGQYAQSLRRAGYPHRIVSFEPLPEPNAYLYTLAQGDPAWQIAAPVALGAAFGEVSLNVSAESEMSSVLPFTPAMGEGAGQQRDAAPGGGPAGHARCSMGGARGTWSSRSRRG